MEDRFATLPRRLQKMACVKEIGGVPCLIARQDNALRPFLFWMHGRTAYKELDPGRFLRCLQRGINICAVDLPGHGQRLEAESQGANRIWPVVEQMSLEIDAVLEGLKSIEGFDIQRCAIGGMSAGGMAAITRLLKPHPFSALVLEATCGDWSFIRNKPMCAALSEEEFDAINPINHLDQWENIPVIAFHSEKDEWIPYEAASSFIESLRARLNDSADIDLVSFKDTGAPYEHVGFGRESANVKELQTQFLVRHLRVTQEFKQ